MKTKTVPHTIRQGDLLLIRVASAPAGLVQKPTKDGKLTIGYGEVSGHNHVLENAVWVVGEDVTQNDLREFALGNKTFPVFVVVEEPTRLVHQEHSALMIDPGFFQVIRQREYEPGQIRSVRD